MWVWHDVGIICLHEMCPAVHCEGAAHHREYALITTSTSRSLARIRCSDRRTAQHRGVSVARHRERLALLVHGLPVALEYVLLMTLEYEVHTLEDVCLS